MTRTDRTSTVDRLNSVREVKVSFSPGVRAALTDLAAAVHFSEHFDSDIRNVLLDWTTSSALNAHDVLVAFPALAQETFRHIHATGDSRAREAWDELRDQMVEKGFNLSATSERER